MMPSSQQYIDRGPREPHMGHGLWISISHRFGPRMTEWVIATITALLGVVILLPTKMFEQNPGWSGFAQFASENAWGCFFLFMGSFRIIGLIINGARKNVTPWIRVISAGVGFVIWIGVCTAFAFSGVVGAWLAIYPVVAATELINIYRAATDAGENHAASSS